MRLKQPLTSLLAAGALWCLAGAALAQSLPALDALFNCAGMVANGSLLEFNPGVLVGPTTDGGNPSNGTITSGLRNTASTVMPPTIKAKLDPNRFPM